MTSSKGIVGMGGSLAVQRIPHPRIHKARTVKTPFGRLGFTRDKGDGAIFGEGRLMSHLSAVHRGRDGRIKDVYDLGSGLITNSGVVMLANDFSWAAGATLKQMNQHILGTGTTAAALSDVYVQTPILAASLTGSTNGYQAGTQTFVQATTAVPHPIYQTVATFTCLAANLAVTEWALAMAAVLPVNNTATGTHGNNTFQDTGHTFVTAGNGVQGYTVEAIAASPINTPTSTNFGIVSTNTTTVLTILGPSASPAWLTLLAATGAVPGVNGTYSLFPTIFDHKVFSAINLVTSDTLAITYQAQITSGG